MAVQEYGMVGRPGTNARVSLALVAGLLLVALALAPGCKAGCCPQPCDAPCAAPACEPCAATPETCSPPPMPCQGQCGEVWCQVWIPPVTKTLCETVCVKCACKKTVWLPPQYGTRPKLCCMAPATLEERMKPPVWTTKQRDVLVCAPQEGWKKVCCPPATDDPCMPQECWEKTCTPAVWGKECCPVCVSPEKYCLKYTPPQYRMVEERYLVEPGRCEEICEPPMYEQRFKEVCCCPGHWEWRRNPNCEPPKPKDLPALQVVMTDKTQSGEEAGIFQIGSIVRYDLQIIGDQGNTSMGTLTVKFTLPPELQFVSGRGEEGVTVSGSGQQAVTSPFALPADGSIGMTVLVKAIGVPANNLVQFTASVQAADGFELAVETESTTLKPMPAGQ